MVSSNAAVVNMNILNRRIYLPLFDTCSEMIEGVGHEFMDDFFGCCESLLAPDGLFVLQVSTNRREYHIGSVHPLRGIIDREL